MLGQDDFSLRESLTELKQRLGDAESLSLNTTVFDGRHLTLAELLNACNTPPFLGTHRLVIVEGLLGRLDRRRDEESPDAPDLDEWKALAESCRNLPPSTVLIFIDGDVSKGNMLLKSLRPISEVREFAPLKAKELESWINSRVSLRGGRISAAAVSLLASLAGDSLWMLANEVDKLCLYAGSSPIEREDIQLLTSYAREASVFPIVDAIVERRMLPAIRLMHHALAEGMSPQYLLAMLTRQLRLLVHAVDLGAGGGSVAEKRQQLGLSPRYPVDKLLRQSARYSLPRLVRAYEKLLETDVAIKTGKRSDELALDLLVAELCA